MHYFRKCLIILQQFTVRALLGRVLIIISRTLNNATDNYLDYVKKQLTHALI